MIVDWIAIDYYACLQCGHLRFLQYAGLSDCSAPLQLSLPRHPAPLLVSLLCGGSEVSPLAIPVVPASGFCLGGLSLPSGGGFASHRTSSAPRSCFVSTWGRLYCTVIVSAGIGRYHVPGTRRGGVPSRSPLVSGFGAHTLLTVHNARRATGGALPILHAYHVSGTPGSWPRVAPGSSGVLGGVDSVRAWRSYVWFRALSWRASMFRPRGSRVQGMCSLLSCARLGFLFLIGRFTWSSRALRSGVSYLMALRVRLRGIVVASPLRQ